jgi:adenine C2-methylase RlmN of 23S rRNA A2503 and tRNA A37
MSGTVKVKCKCENAFQDKTYGKGVRVANRTAKGEARCTVCGQLHGVNSTEERKRK